MTIEEAVLAQPIRTSLKSWDKESRVVTIANLVAIVTQGLAAFGSKNKMTGPMISLWVNDFLELYYTDSFEDLAMMFKLARQQQLSKDYHYVDGLLLFEWYKQYLQLKLDKREKILHDKKIKPEDYKNTPISEMGQKIIKKITDELKEPKKEIIFPTQSERRMQQLEAHIALARSDLGMFTTEQLKFIIKDCRSNGLEGDAVYLEDQLKG